VSQCPFESGRDEVCKCPRGPRVPTGRFNGLTLKVHIALPAVTFAYSVRCVHKNVRKTQQDAARNGMERDVGMCEERGRILCFLCLFVN
jgi:hypothetical protein